MILSIGCGGNSSYPESTLGDVNIDLLCPNEKCQNFIIADAMNLPFRDGTFDKAIAYHIIEHLPDPYRFLEECRRVSLETELKCPCFWDPSAYIDPNHKWVLWRGGFVRVSHFMQLVMGVLFLNKYARWFVGKGVRHNREVKLRIVDQRLGLRTNVAKLSKGALDREFCVII